MISNKFLLFTILFIVLLIFIFFSCKIFGRQEYTAEGFQNSESEYLSFKRTLEFTQVYTCDLYTIWEPIPIDDYYPIGHYLTHSKNKPPLGILVKSDNKNDKPKSFTLITKTSENYGIWKPEPNDGYVCMGHIYSKKMPSIHSIRCVQKDNVIEDQLVDRLVDSSTYDIWSLKESDLFLVNVVANKNIPFDTPYKLNINRFTPTNKLRIKTTSEYQHMGSFLNEDLKKRVCIYRPLPPSEYVSLGDIATTNNEDPNKQFDSIVVHTDDIKFPTGYGNTYVTKLTDKELNSNQPYTFWKPVPPPGYVSLGLVLNKSKNEPDSTDIIGCIPFEYVNILKGNDLREEAWNNKPKQKSICIMCDSSKRFIIDKQNHKSNILFTINEDYINIERDMLDFPKDIVFTYELNTSNTYDYTDIQRENYLKKMLSNRFDVSINRFNNIKYDIEYNKIYVTIDSRPINSDELLVGELVEVLMKTILDSDIKIQNEDHKTISVLTSCKIINDNKKELFIDNSKYINIQ
tara:strand:+ start:2311 stop:3861 length:1551 start_codon:yes stop_codon:yes gene_type:complete